jgi:thiol:disulfide interchange protein DsbG
MKKRFDLLLSALLTVIVYPAIADNADSDRLVTKMAGPQSVIDKRFDAAPGIDGFIVRPANGNPVLVYVDQAGQFLFSGVLFSKEGQNLTRSHHDQYMPKPDPLAILKEAEPLPWITDGSADAPALLYIAAEPHCGHCKTLYSALRPFVSAKRVQVRWLFTGFTPDARKSASSLLASSNSEDAMRKVFGGTALDGGTDQDPKIQANADFMLKHGIRGTPHLFYQDKSGSLQSRPGALTGEALASLLSEVTRSSN